METKQVNKVIDIKSGNRKCKALMDVNIYRENPKFLLHPVLLERRKRLLLKRKMSQRWF